MRAVVARDCTLVNREDRIKRVPRSMRTVKNRRSLALERARVVELLEGLRRVFIVGDGKVLSSIK